ncbi:MAG: LemA family protein [Bacteroidales bacterium]|nr:LemA family protein [Bacteroidales bacterium]
MKNVKLIVTLGVVFLVIVIIYASVKGTYNSIIRYDEQVTASWSQVVTDYQRRMDLIPNLVNVVKGYADFEQETLIGVIEARASATKVQLNVNNLDENALQQIEKSQQAVSSALSRLLVTVERYPDLKANTNFRDLQAQLEGTENRIANARRKFNESTQTYNSYIRQFPKNIYANFFGFEKKPYFEAAVGAEKAPEVQF